MNYLDKEYDGLVIKLPAAIITINSEKLNPILKQLQDVLDDELLLSKYHPDIQKSIYELQHYKDKSTNLKEEQRLHEIALQKQRDYTTKLLNHDIIEIKYKTIHEQPRHEDIYVPSRHEDIYVPFKDGHEEVLSQSDIMTNKGSIKTSATKYLTDNYDKIDILKFAKLNMIFHACNCIENIPADYPIDKVLKFTGFSLSRYSWDVRIISEILYIKYYMRDKSGGLIYYEFPVSFNKEGNLYMKSPRNDCVDIDLSEYTFQGYKLIKNN